MAHRRSCICPDCAHRREERVNRALAPYFKPRLPAGPSLMSPGMGDRDWFFIIFATAGLHANLIILMVYFVRLFQVCVPIH